MGISDRCSTTSPEPSPWRKTADDLEGVYNVRTLLTDLKSCSVRRDLEWGRKIHAKAVRSQHDSNVYILTALMTMYGKCGSMMDARQMFDSIEKPDIVSWNVLLLGYADNGNGVFALDLFSTMKERGYVPNSKTYVAALKACTSLAVNADNSRKSDWLERGRDVHSEVGSHLNLYVQNTLVDMYAKCGSMVEARRVFDNTQYPDVVSWNALVSGYTENGEGLLALELFSRMKSRGCIPDSVTYVVTLKACTCLVVNADDSEKGDCLERGRKIHSEIGRNLDHFVQSTLIDMYAKCGSMVEARSVFDSIVKPDRFCWTALLLGYAENREGLAALELFSRMKARKCLPDSVTYVAALKACTYLAVDAEGSAKRDWLQRGRGIHSEIGFHLNLYVQNTLVDMYSKCGSMVDARRVFDRTQNPDVVSWNAVILGYAENGDGFTALELFSKMKARECVPDSITYIAALKACGVMGALTIGRKFHLEISEFTGHVVTCLVDFYAKCGSLVEARKAFDSHPKSREVSTWNALLAAYGSFGDTCSVFELFQSMQDLSYQPDAVTFLCILSSCSHAGLVEKATDYFEAMPLQYSVSPSVVHYSCMVDALGRANKLNEAVALLEKMPYTPNEVTWMTLLGACQKWKNIEIGRCAFQYLVDIDKKNESAYVLMANLYGSMGMREEQEKVLELRAKLGCACKLRGQAHVIDEVGKMVKFVDGKEDPSEIKEKLEELVQGMKLGDYIAESYSTNVADGEKREAVCGHSERRAVVYGLWKTPCCGEAVRVFKNMRTCDDCHSSTKMISKVFQRVVMIRDTNRLHIMANGSCSCGDYW